MGKQLSHNQISTELVAKAMQGDKQAFEELCRLKSQSILYLTAKLMDNDVEAAEKIALSIIAHMYQGISQLASPEEFNGWLNKLIYDVCTAIRAKQGEPIPNPEGVKQ